MGGGMSYAYEYDVKYNICHLRKKEQNEVKNLWLCIQSGNHPGKLIRRVMTPISRTYIFDKSTDDFFYESSTELEKQMVLRARRLIRFRVRLLRSMC